MAQKKHKVLIVDDEEDILEFIQYNLTKDGFDVTTANNGKLAIDKAKEIGPELILLDVMMPEMDGIETCMELRDLKETKDAVIMFLTARGEDYSQIAGFEAGADDYITKPINPRVLIQRIKAVFRRVDKKSEPEADQNVEGLHIDRERYVVINNGKELHLPKKEFELLALLISSPGKVFTRDNILSSVWGDDVVVGDRTIDVHIRKLREKIGESKIKTVKGVGYKIKAKWGKPLQDN